MIKIAILTLAWAPVYALVLGMILILITDLVLRESATSTIVLLGTVTLTAAAFLVSYVRANNNYSGELFRFGEFYQYFALIGLLSSIIVVFAAWKDFNMELDIGIFFSLLILANIGGILIAASQNFIALYLGYELVSIPTYAMVAFRKNNRNAAEAGLKIFLLGALSSAMIIYGLVMYYGATGTFAFGASRLPGSTSLVIAAVVLIASGCAFKIGLVPFHFWIPDVYNGAPLSVVNFLAASSKKMAFAFVFQLFFFGMAPWFGYWGVLFAILATLSILLGNIAAVIQDKLMRIIAYSTIAQAGYIAIGIVAYAAAAGDSVLQLSAMKGIVFHIAAHVLMKGAAIVAVLMVINTYGNDHIDNFRGLFHKSPFVSGTLALALFSLMGIPPLAGFFGKFFLFLSAVEAGVTWLAIIGVIGSAISIYYYARVIRVMADKPEDDTPVQTHPGLIFILAVLSVLTIILGLFGDAFVNIAEKIITTPI